MKKLSGIVGAIGLALVALAGSANAQIQQIWVPELEGRDVAIPEGKWIKFHVVGVTGGSPDQREEITNINGDVILSVASGSPLRDLSLPVIGGGLHFNTGMFATFEFIDPPCTVALRRPSNAVVIPADDAGDVEIILESSTDMVTWTPAFPGTYSTATEKRFFRVRAVRVGE